MCWHSLDLGVVRIEQQFWRMQPFLFILCDIVDFLFSIPNFNNVEAEVRGSQHFLWMLKQLYEVGYHDK